MRWRSTPGPRSHTTNLWRLRLVRLRTDTEILIGSLSQSDTEIGHIQAKRVAHRDSKQGCVPFLCILCGLSYFFCHTTQFNPVVLVQVSQSNRNTSLCGSESKNGLFFSWPFIIPVPGGLLVSQCIWKCYYPRYELKCAFVSLC